MKEPHISIIVAIGINRAIGKNGKLLWHIPDDLDRFKLVTYGHPVIMSSELFESTRATPLSERPHIVVTGDPVWQYEGVIVARSIEDALTQAKELDQEEIFIRGGGSLYEAVLPYADRFYLTLIEDEKEGDSYFPVSPDYFKKKVFHEVRQWNNLTYHWIELERE
ncbi:dihydrofolate reductase [Candidatus Kaiserbacteria bacterium]|nr:dihydrofolate reductase [Candidatus Kaiserbacteria bacterium]